jgi:hypothetical protein
MSGKIDKVTGEEDLGVLKEKLNEDLGTGSKIGVDERLNFYFDDSSEFGKASLEAIEKGEFIKFIVEKSNEIAEKLNDQKADTYDRIASNIAKIIKKYIDIAPRWNELVKDESKKYEDTLRRYLGTHQGIAEPFLAKIIEKTKGISERDAFVTTLNNQGFDYVEGFAVEIDTLEDGKEKVRISFKKEKDGKVIFEFNEIVSKELIESLIIEKK